MDCTKTMAQCMLLHAPDHGFPNSTGGGGNFSPSEDMGNVAWGDLIYMVVRT